MARITEELIRKRAEHNEREISTLEELALHQENIIKIEHLDRWCKELRILMLQSNLISKIENMGRLKLMEYLNLALNNIEVIENLEECESLQKLDLTLNFIGDLGSIKNLKNNIHLESLFLTGNPCSDYPGYRDFVIANLPQLKEFDGTLITRSERILALQNLEKISTNLPAFQRKYRGKREKQKKEAEISASHMKIDDTSDLEETSRFWNEKSENTPETRVEIAERTRRAQKAAEQSNDPKPTKRKIRFFKEDGSPFNINEAKIPFKLKSDDETNSIVLTVETYKYMDTSLIDIDVQPKYIRIAVKGKTLQLAFNEEVQTDAAVAQRSQATGHLTVIMPKVDGEVKKNDDLSKLKAGKSQNADIINTSYSRRELLEIGSRDPIDYSNIIRNNEKARKENSKMPKSSKETCESENKRQIAIANFEDNDEVPPLE